MTEGTERQGLFRKLSKPHLVSMALGTTLGFMAAASTVGLMAVSGWFISASALAGLLPTTAHLFNYFLPGVALRLFALLRTTCRYGERVVNHDATFRILESMRVWFYKRLEPLAPAGIQLFRRGDLLTRVVADIDTLDQLYLRILSPNIVAGLTILLTCGLLAVFHVPTAVCTLAVMVLAALGTSLFTAWKGETVGRKMAANWTEHRTRVVEGLQGLAELTIFGGLESHRDRVTRCQASLVECQRRMAFMRGGAAALVQVLAGAAALLVIVLLSGPVFEEKLGGAILAGMVLAVLAAFESIFPLPGAHLLLGRTRESARRLAELAETPAPVVFPSASPAEPREFSIHFQQVRFRYGPGLPWALDGVTLHLPHGRRTAVIGESGAGKSSLAHLLVRFFDPGEGRILLGGLDLHSLSEEDLRRHVVVLSQQAHLFAATIRENLLLARPDGRDEELERALAAAHLGSFLETLPRGLDTYVGESGQLLSAGQARRLALARAILKDAPIWVLDEPTEGLDRQTERQLMESLLDVTRNRTVLWITHRLMDLRRMDQVVWLDGGRMVDQGTHESLLVRNPRYRLWCARMR